MLLKVEQRMKDEREGIIAIWPAAHDTIGGGLARRAAGSEGSRQKNAPEPLLRLRDPRSRDGRI